MQSFKSFLSVISFVLLILYIACSQNIEKNNIQDTSENSDQVSTSEKEIQDSSKENDPELKVLVTFVELGSVNCIPCKMMQPIMKEIEKEYKKQVKVVFHDVWKPEGQPYAVNYKIRVIPTQVFLDKDGNEFFRHEGFIPKEEIVKLLKSRGVE